MGRGNTCCRQISGKLVGLLMIICTPDGREVATAWAKGCQDVYSQLGPNVALYLEARSPVMAFVPWDGCCWTERLWGAVPWERCYSGCVGKVKGIHLHLCHACWSQGQGLLELASGAPSTVFWGFSKSLRRKEQDSQPTLRFGQHCHEVTSVNRHLKCISNLILKRKRQKSLVVREKQYALSKWATPNNSSSLHFTK